jgi:hypothetical protein
MTTVGRPLAVSLGNSTNFSNGQGHFSGSAIRHSNSTSFATRVANDRIIHQHIVAEVVAECAEIRGIPATTKRERPRHVQRAEKIGRVGHVNKIPTVLAASQRVVRYRGTSTQSSG